MTSHPQDAASAVELGLDAIRQRRWRKAYELLVGEDWRRETDPVVLEALADAAHAVGEQELSLRVRQAAHAAQLGRGERGTAAATAIKIANAFVRRRELAVAGGWIGTAERLLAGEPQCAGHGLVAWVKGMSAMLFERDLHTAQTLAEETIAIGNRLQDPELLTLGITLQGEAHAKEGHASEAFPLLDEAMTRAVGSTLSPWVSCHVLCRTLLVCQETGDVRRAQQWMAAARAACDSDETAPISGECRVHHACLLNQQGSWPEAEQEAQMGCQELPGDLWHVGIAAYELGEIQLRRGDYAGAQAAFERANELGQSPYPGLALLRLAQRNLAAARTMISGALEDETFAFRRALLLAAQAEIALASDDRETARQMVTELGRLQESLSAVTVDAASKTAAGALALADGELKVARTQLRSGVRRWTEAGVPYAAARARLLLAETHLAGGDVDSAQIEGRAAREVFQRLGAQPDAHRAHMLLRRLRPGTEEPQRVARTFMFTDMVGSTPLAEALGDDAWADLRRWHDTCLRREFAMHAGQEIDHAGDGFFIAFPNPADALRCAESIQRRLRDHRRAYGFAPKVRIGVHADAAGTTDDGYVGHGVHAAARICAQAQGGEILVSRTTLEATGEEFLVGEPRIASLKGLNQPIQLQALIWE